LSSSWGGMVIPINLGENNPFQGFNKAYTKEKANCYPRRDGMQPNVPRSPWVMIIRVPGHSQINDSYIFVVGDHHDRRGELLSSSQRRLTFVILVLKILFWKLKILFWKLKILFWKLKILFWKFENFILKIENFILKIENFFVFRWQHRMVKI
jgi:hypothetical protein